MERSASSATRGSRKAAWQTPKLDELGNLRDFVRTGHAYGKSVLTDDGNAMAGGESMPQMS